MADLIKHNGKGMPVDGNTLVEVKIRYGFEFEAGLAKNWLRREGSTSNWHHEKGRPHPCDIIEYRVVSREAAPMADHIDIVERVARAICASDPGIRMGDAAGVVQQRVEREWQNYRHFAKTALEAAGVAELAEALEEAIQWDGQDDVGIDAVWLVKARAALARYRGE